MGGTTNKLTKTKSSSSSTKKINSTVKLKKIENNDTDYQYRCSCCGKEYPKRQGNFHVSNSLLYAGNNGYLTICKSCVENYYQQLIGYYSGNEVHALEHCCWMYDWYYSDEAAAMTKNISQGRSRVSAYPSKMNMAQIRSKGTTYLDTLHERHNDRVMEVKESNIEDIDETTSISKTAPEVVEFFGLGYTDDEYTYLLDQYEEWVRRAGCNTKAREEIIKGLCIAQVNMRRAQKEGTPKEVNEALKVFQDLMGAGNLKPSQNPDSSVEEQNTFGTLIKKWENEEPISTPDNEWKDVDGIKKYIDTFFLGHLCNLVHIKNDYEESYRAEMEKYTVKPPTYEGEDVVETSLLDMYSDRGEPNDNT